MAPRSTDAFSVISWNVRGLNSKFKRALLFQYLKSHNPHILILQETHLLGSKLMALKRQWVQNAFHASYSTYARGVSVLVSKSLTCEIEAVHTDPQGKFVVVVAQIWHKRYIFVGVYIPPPFHPHTLYSILEKIAPYTPAKLLIMGDFNSILSPELDRPTPPKSHTGGFVQMGVLSRIDRGLEVETPGLPIVLMLLHVL